MSSGYQRGFENVGSAYAPAWTEIAPVGLAASVNLPDDSVHHPAFQRMMARLPAPIRQSLNHEQRRALAAASMPEPASHLIAYRVSVPIFKRRYYLSVLMGRDRRSLARLVGEGQVGRYQIIATYVCALALLVGVAVLGAVLLALAFEGVMRLDTMSVPPPWAM